MNWFTTADKGGARDAGRRPGSDAMNGNAVMYDAGKILTFGGSQAYEGIGATSNTILISLTGTNVTTKPVGAMKRARAFASGVVLPDGKVLVVGGQAMPMIFTDTTAAMECGAFH
jgi:galactose oxidase